MPETLSEAMESYRGIHYPYPPHFGWPRGFYWFWRKWLCKKEMHLWSEVCSSGDPEQPHYLVCDACQLMVIVHKIDTTYSEKYGITKNSQWINRE